MSSDIVFRTAELKDVFELHKLVNIAYRGDDAKIGWTTEADFLDGQRIDTEALSEMIEAPYSTILCACDRLKKEITGCVHLKKEKDRCYLGMLTVQPNLQNLGLGKHLLEQSENQAKAWNCAFISMYVISLRKELIAFYERRGFQRTADKKPFPYGNSRFGLPKRDDLEFFIFEKSTK